MGCPAAPQSTSLVSHGLHSKIELKNDVFQIQRIRNVFPAIDCRYIMRIRVYTRNTYCFVRPSANAHYDIYCYPTLPRELRATSMYIRNINLSALLIAYLFLGVLRSLKSLRRGETLSSSCDAFRNQAPANGSINYDGYPPRKAVEGDTYYSDACTEGGRVPGEPDGKVSRNACGYQRWIGALLLEAAEGGCSLDKNRRRVLITRYPRTAFWIYRTPSTYVAYISSPQGWCQYRLVTEARRKPPSFAPNITRTL